MNKTKIKIDYRALAAETIRILRGDKTQTGLSKKLGFESNQVYRWEAMQRSVSWPDFVSYCSLVKVDLKQAMKAKFGYAGSLHETAQLVRHLCGVRKIQEVADLTGISRSVLSKWLNAKSTPLLQDIFELVDKNNGQLFVLLEKLAAIENFQTVDVADYLRRREKYKCNYANPMTGAFLALLGLGKYKTKASFIASAKANFLMTEDEVKAVVKEMIRVGYLKEVNGFWEVQEDELNTAGDREGMSRIRAYWFELALNKIQQNEWLDSLSAAGNNFNYAVFDVTAEGDKKVREATFQYIAALRNIVMNDKGEKNVVRSVSVASLKFE